MIGQQKLLQQIDKLIESGFPRFIIIVGSKGSGKTLLSEFIAKKLNAHLIRNDIKVDNIRELINMSYKQSEPTLYLLSECDKMSSSAKNALLKITEEPPRKAYFIMTLEDVNNTLETLKSRGTVLSIDPYTPNEILEYAKLKKYNLEDNETLVSNICNCPGEIDTLVQYNINDFYSFVNTTVDNIGKVNGANAFKIGNRLSYKEEDNGWDIELFLKTIMHVCRNQMEIVPVHQYLDSIVVTSKYLSQIKIKGINKSASIDMWVLEMRGVWSSDD